MVPGAQKGWLNRLELPIFYGVLPMHFYWSLA